MAGKLLVLCLLVIPRDAMAKPLPKGIARKLSAAVVPNATAVGRKASAVGTKIGACFVTLGGFGADQVKAAQWAYTAEGVECHEKFAELSASCLDPAKAAKLDVTDQTMCGPAIGMFSAKCMEAADYTAVPHCYEAITAVTTDCMVDCTPSATYPFGKCVKTTGTADEKMLCKYAIILHGTTCTYKAKADATYAATQMSDPICLQSCQNYLTNMPTEDECKAYGYKSCAYMMSKINMCEAMATGAGFSASDPNTLTNPCLYNSACELMGAWTVANPVHINKAPWGPTLGAVGIIFCVPLLGYIFVAPPIRKLVQKNYHEMNAVFGGWAAGALIACTFFLRMYTSMSMTRERLNKLDFSDELAGEGLLAKDAWTEEKDPIWHWGICVIAGLFFPLLSDIGYATPGPFDRCAKRKPQEDGTIKPETTFNEKWRKVECVIIGDFIMKFADGLWLATTFWTPGCGDGLGWRMALVTVLHEWPQEIADYLILTGPGCNMRPWVAMTFNICTGEGLWVGAILTLMDDCDMPNDEGVVEKKCDPNEDASMMGMMMGFACGCYLFLAATECMPRTVSNKVSPAWRLAGTLAFLLAVISIALVLLMQEDCIVNMTPAKYNKIMAQSMPGGQMAKVSNIHR